MLSYKRDDTSSDLAKSDLDADMETLRSDDRRRLERRLLRKLDLRMAYLIVIYILNIIDRNNTPAARLRGFERDLGLVGTQYSTVLSILFVGYILMQIPSNMLMNYLGKPSVYLPLCTILWGTISALTGVIKNFTGALLCRFFLGFVEAAFVPGALFFLSKWYKRNELGLRITILFCASFISSAFGSLLAAGVLDGMEGKLGHAAWRWLFYIEGSVTIFLATIGFFILPDFPATSSSWLTPAEKELAEKRMLEEACLSKAEDDTVGRFQGFVQAFTDWKVWWLAVIMALVQLSLSFMAFFPTLTATLGYDVTTTLLLCAPPWVLTTIVAFLLTRHSDATSERCWHSVLPMMLGIVGSIIAMSTMNTAARYVSLFLMAQSPMGPVITLAWAVTSIQPPNKCAVGIALINSFSHLGLVAGPYAWDKSWGPSYRKSFAVCIAASFTSITMSLILRQCLARLNRKAEEDEKRRGQAEAGFRFML